MDVNALKPRQELHSIALRCIFDFLMPPSGILDYTMTYGPHSGWLTVIRTLKSVALVCSSWNAAAIPLLYRDVVIRRVGQLAAFSRTVQSAPQLFATHVRSLTLCCFVPESWMSVSRRFLEQIVGTCSDTIKTLSMQGTFPATRLLSQSSNDESSPNLLLPFLQKVPCICAFDTPAHMQDPTTIFVLPAGIYNNLRSLSIFVRFRLGLGGPCTGSPSVFTFVEKYSATLRNLDFGECIRPILATQAGAASLCPHLDHLVLGTIIANDTTVIEAVVMQDLKSDSASLKHVRLVDIVVRHIFPRETRFTDHINVEEWEWQHVRLLDGHLVTQIPNLAYLFPGPSAMRDGDPPRIMDFYGVRIQETRSSLQFAEGWESIDHIYSLSDTSDGADATTDEGDSEVGSTEWEESTDEEDDEEYMGAVDRRFTPVFHRRTLARSVSDEEDTDEESEWEVTEDEALAIFEGTLQRH